MILRSESVIDCFASGLAQIRADRGLTPDGMAALCGLSVRTYNEYESGEKTCLSLSSAARIESRLGERILPNLGERHTFSDHEIKSIPRVEWVRAVYNCGHGGGITFRKGDDLPERCIICGCAEVTIL